MYSATAAKSRILKAIIYIHWISPVGYILALMALYNLPLAKTISIFFSVYYILRSLLNVLVGVLIYQSKPWAWHIYVINAILMCAEQFYFGFMHSETHLLFPSILIALTAIILGFILVKLEFRVPYFSPQIAWWESDPRYKTSVPVNLSVTDHFHSGEIMDISTSGCFIKTKSNFKIDDAISLRFSIFDQEFFIRGRVVWSTESALTHPKGIGVRFYALDKEDHAFLRETVKKLQGISKKLRKESREEKVSSIEKRLKDTRNGN